MYLEDISNGHQPGKGDKLTPLFTNKSDREKFKSINNKTKYEIKSIIFGEIEQIRAIGADDIAESLIQTWNRQIKTQKKDAYIMLYKTEVCVAFDETVNNHPVLGRYFLCLFTFIKSQIFMFL